MTDEILTHREVVSRGGKARWRGVSKKARSKAMKEVRAAGVKKQALAKVDNSHDKLARQV